MTDTAQPETPPALVTVVLLLTYQLFVRHAPIGTMLNGKRSRPTGPATPAGR